MTLKVLFEVGRHLVLLFTEAVGLLAKIPGFLPGDWRTEQAWNGVPGAIRTLDPLLRRQLLCPSELQGQVFHYPNVAQALR